MDGIEAFETHHGRHVLERELETLADVLPLLVARDDDRPARWLSAAFERDIAVVRSRVARVAQLHLLAARLGPASNAPTDAEAGRLERASRRLAADPSAVALAIRCLEIRHDLRFPTWAEILRRRAIHPALSSPTSAEASAWFG